MLSVIGPGLSSTAGWVWDVMGAVPSSVSGEHGPRVEEGCHEHRATVGFNRRVIPSRLGRRPNMSYVPILLLGLVGVVLFVVAMTLPMRRRSRQTQTIDRDPMPPAEGTEGAPGSRRDRARHGKP